MRNIEELRTKIADAHLCNLYAVGGGGAVSILTDSKKYISVHAESRHGNGEKIPFLFPVSLTGERVGVRPN